MNWKIFGIFAGVTALLLRFFFSLFPQVTETIYSRGIFVAIRYGIDYTIGWLPFPLVYPLLVFFFLLMIWRIRHWWLQRRENVKKENKPRKSWNKRFVATLLGLAGGIGMVIAFAYFIWGFNYWRVPIEKHMDMKVIPLDGEDIRREAELALQLMVSAKEKVRDRSFVWSNLETEIRGDLEGVLKHLNYPTPGRVRGRKLHPGGLSMAFGVSGIYNFITGEAYVPDSLLPMETPFVLAHEMAHGYGFCEEGTANFLAYLACLSSRNALIRYSGCYHYFVYISWDLYRVSKEESIQLGNRLPQEVREDMLAVKRNWDRYRGFLKAVGQVVNDTYLKSQGIKEGIKSYNRLVMLASAWRKTRGRGI